MIDTELKDLRRGLSTDARIEKDVDFLGKSIWKVSHPKRKASYLVRRTNDGFIFYEVRNEKGTVPKELSTKFTSPKSAITAVVRYLEKTQESPAVSRDNKYALRTGSN